MKKWKFVSMMAGDKPVEADDFEGAWRAMYAWVNKQLAEGNMSYQVLETSIWLESPKGLPIFFYDARDMAIDQGIMEKIAAEEAPSKAS